MPGSNANWRNLAVDDRSTLRLNADFNGSGNVPPTPPLQETFIELHCGDNLNSALTKNSFHPFKRTNDLIENTRYFARFFNFQIDDIKTVVITVTSNQFSPFLSFYRNAANIVRSSLGTITKDVLPNTIGPWTLEVSSIDPYDIGDFNIQITCATLPPTLFLVTPTRVSLLVGQVTTWHTDFLGNPVATDITLVVRLENNTTIVSIGQDLMSSTPPGSDFVTEGAADQYIGAITTVTRHVYAYATAAPTFKSNEVTITVRDPLSLSCAAITSQPFIGTFGTGYNANDAGYVAPGPRITGGGTAIMTGTTASNGTMIYHKSDSDTGCPIGTYHIVQNLDDNSLPSDITVIE